MRNKSILNMQKNNKKQKTKEVHHWIKMAVSLSLKQSVTFIGLLVNKGLKDLLKTFWDTTNKCENKNFS